MGTKDTPPSPAAEPIKDAALDEVSGGGVVFEVEVTHHDPDAGTGTDRPGVWTDMRPGKK